MYVRSVPLTFRKPSATEEICQATVLEAHHRWDIAKACPGERQQITIRVKGRTNDPNPAWQCQPPYPDPCYCHMRFFFSGELDARVAEPYRETRRTVESALNDALGTKDYGPVLDKIAFIPIILGPEYGSERTERRLVQRRQRAADYRPRVDFDSFLHGGAETRVRLLVDSLLMAVADIKRKLGKDFDGYQLHVDIRALFPDSECQAQVDETIARAD